MLEVCNKRFNTWAFPYWPGYHPSAHIGPRLRLWPIWWSRDDNQANMEMPMYEGAESFKLHFHLSVRVNNMAELVFT
jgi:hypothetical protein